MHIQILFVNCLQVLTSDRPQTGFRLFPGEVGCHVEPQTVELLNRAQSLAVQKHNPNKLLGLKKLAQRFQNLGAQRKPREPLLVLPVVSGVRVRIGGILGKPGLEAVVRV